MNFKLTGVILKDKGNWLVCDLANPHPTKTQAIVNFRVRLGLERSNRSKSGFN